MFIWWGECLRVKGKLLSDMVNCHSLGPDDYLVDLTELRHISKFVKLSSGYVCESFFLN